MNISTLWRTRFGAIAFGAMSLAPAVPTTPAPVEVTARDVEASNQKIAAAYGSLADMWTKNFQQIGERFVVPRIARYNTTVSSPCGVIRTNNAQYCERNNTVYYDEVFAAGMAKRAAQALHTDGDMAAIGIIAHETGHAVAMQLGHYWRTSYDNEAAADCLAGAFARQAQHDGSLEDGDLDEAFFGMALAGDPTPEPTGNARYDAIIQARLSRASHGTREQRTENFRDGLNGGPGACLDDFRTRNSQQH
jgi:predicted metalloprotease